MIQWIKLAGHNLLVPLPIVSITCVEEKKDAVQQHARPSSYKYSEHKDGLSFIVTALNGSLCISLDHFTSI